jgi:hypothetical protein
VIAAAVLALVQAGLVVLASFYVVFFASVVDLAASGDPASAPAAVDGLATEGTVVGIVQLVSALALIVGGVMALNSRRRPAFLVLLAGLAVQVVLAGYWFVRISAVAGDIPGPDPTGAFLAFTLLFAAGPLVGLGLLLHGPARPWFGIRRIRAAGTQSPPPGN